MKKEYRKLSIIAAAIIMVFFSTAFIQQQSTWKAPVSADQKKNPIVPNEQTLTAGKSLYNKECASCHGKKGKGDGPASITLGKPVGDMTTAGLQSQSDGAIFWKTAEGKQPMPSFKKKLSEEQVWEIVNYIRTFKTK